MYCFIAFLMGVISYVCIADELKEFSEDGIIAAIIIFFVGWFALWRIQPVLSLSYGVWILWIIIPALIVAGTGYEMHFRRFVPAIVVLLASLYYIFSSTGMVASRSMQRMLDLTEMADSAYCRDIAQIQPESMILVDEELARKYAEATLEQDPATGSICDVGDLSIQNLNGTFKVRLADGKEKTLTFNNEQVYVAPLEHSGFFKWNRKRVTPGYIMVSAMKQNVVYFVTEVNGEKLKLRYLKTGRFKDYWKRHVRKSGYYNVRFADRNIELDDNGIPFMVIPVKENTRAYTCSEITKVILLNIQTGEVKDYSLQDVPAWVDRVYPSYMIQQRIEWWGRFQKGWWNSLFAREGVRAQTPGIEQVYTNGDCYWYTGIKSGGADDGTSGFMLTNTRTGKSKLYAISGVNEEASRHKISNYKIEAANIYPSRVLMYNIKNEPTYFATCKAESGEFMGYAFASVKYRDVCGVGKTVNEAYEAYAKSMRSSRTHTSLEGFVVKDEKSFTVVDLTKENDNYYFLFEEAPGKEFSCPSDISLELKWTRIGDTVSVSYEEGTSNQVTLESFDNERVQL